MPLSRESFFYAAVPARYIEAQVKIGVLRSNDINAINRSFLK